MKSVASHVVFGLPCGFLVVCVAFTSACLAGVSGSSRSRWPVHDRRRLKIVRLQGSVCVLWYRSSLLIILGHLTFITLRSSLLWKESIWVSSVLFSVHSSELYRKMLSV